MKISKNQITRLDTLERLYTPGPEWTITARFKKDGAVKTMSAREYRQVKLWNPSEVEIVDWKPSRNLQELQAWLSMISELAALSEKEEELVI